MKSWLTVTEILSSYLAEIPSACKEKVQELLQYILSIEAESAQRFLALFNYICFGFLHLWYFLFLTYSATCMICLLHFSPFDSICFMLPMLCQATMETEGCRILTSFGGHNAVKFLLTFWDPLSLSLSLSTYFSHNHIEECLTLPS